MPNVPLADSTGHARAHPVRLHWIFLVLLMLFVLSGCVRREGRNSDCQWPKAADVNQRDLRAELEFAEDLAIRYMDAHFGPRDPAVAAQAKNRCMGVLLAEIGKEHGITAQEAFKSFGQRSAAVDLAVNLPFILLYMLAADFLIRRLLKRYRPREGWMHAAVMMLPARSTHPFDRDRFSIIAVGQRHTMKF